MNNQLVLLDNLLGKYKVKEPLPAAVQEHILANHRKNLIKILKKLGRYNPILGAIIFVFFLVKKFGLSFSVMKSAVVLAAASAVTAVTVSTGVYIGVKTVMLMPSLEINDENKPDKEIVIDTILIDAEKWAALQLKSSPGHTTRSKIVQPESVKTFKNRIIVRPFDISNTGDKTAYLVTSKIKKELIRLRGQKNISTFPERGPGVILFGSVEKIGDTYIVSARIARKVTGKVILKTPVEKISKLDDLDKICRKIAKEISGRIE